MNIIEFKTDKKQWPPAKGKFALKGLHNLDDSRLTYSGWQKDSRILDDKKTHIFWMASFPTHGGVAAPSGVPVIAVALHGLPLAPTELAAGLRLAGRAVGPAPAQMTPLADNSIKLFILSDISNFVKGSFII